MKLVRVALLLLVLTFGGCSSPGGEVRSDNGPSAQPTTRDASDDAETTSTSTAAAAVPATSEFIRLQGTVNVPEGEVGKLSVVAMGSGGKSSVPVLVRNRTANTLHGIEVTGTARGSDGKLIGSGSSQGFTPTNVEAGEWAFGYVFYDSGDLPVDAQFDLTATGEKGESSGVFAGVDMKVVEIEVTKGQFGRNQLVGVLQNPTSKEVDGPVSVDVMCFEGDRPVSTHQSFAEGDSVAPNGTASFSVDLGETPCATFAVGSSGYTA